MLHNEDLMNGHPLRVLRTQLDLSQKDFAAQVGVSEATISRAESGHRLSPKVRRQLCDRLGKTSHELGLMGRTREVVSPSTASSNTHQQGDSSAENLAVKPSEKRNAPHLVTLFERTPITPPMSHSEILLPTFSPLIMPQKSIAIAVQNKINLPEIHAEQSFGELLALGASELAAFFDKGWSIDIILDTLRVLLPIIKIMSPFIEHRQQILSFTARENISPLLTKISLTEEQQIHLCQAFHESIDEGWKFFTMARNSQALAISQAQLMLLQQVHAVLPVDEVPLLYSSIYNFMGMALCQQGHYAQALQSHKNAYLAALSTGEALEIIYGLLCQSNSYYGLNSYDTTIEVLKQALRILDELNDIRYAHTKAHTLGIWADAAMMSGDYKTARKKLDASASLLNHIKPNEEFDKSSWYQLLGKYSYLTGDFSAAAQWYEQALSELPLDWIMRRALVIMSLISTYTVIQDRDASLVTVEKAIQLLPTLNAPFINNTLFTALQGLITVFPYDAKIKTTIPELLQLVS